MTDKKPNPNRIPFEELTTGSVSNWSIPSMSTKNRVIKATEKNKKSEIKSEIVEDVHPVDKPEPLTAEQLQVISEEAKRDGYSEGYAQGLKQGLEKGIDTGTEQGKSAAYKEAKDELMDTQSRLRSIAKQLYEPMCQQDNIIENILVDMVMNLSKYLIDTEITQSPSILLKIINRAIEALPVGEKNMAITLHSKDADLLENLISPNEKNWKIERDDSICSGGCLVKTKHSLIDYDIENRLRKYMSDSKNMAESKGAGESQDVHDIDSDTWCAVQDWSEDSLVDTKEEENKPKNITVK